MNIHTPLSGFRFAFGFGWGSIPGFAAVGSASCRFVGVACGPYAVPMRPDDVWDSALRPGSYAMPHMNVIPYEHESCLRAVGERRASVDRTAVDQPSTGPYANRTLEELGTSGTTNTRNYEQYKGKHGSKIESITGCNHVTRIECGLRVRKDTKGA